MSNIDDRLQEKLLAIETGKIQDFPIVLMGRDFWEPLRSFVIERLLKRQTIDPEDVSRLYLTDSPEDTIACIASCAGARIGLERVEAPKGCQLCPAE